MHIQRLASILCLTALAGTGCAERLVPEGAPLEEPRPDASGGDQGSLPSRSGRFTHVVGSDGVVTTVVDASDGAVWQTLDLDSGHADGDGWDLGFSRFRVKSNGGISGGGGVQVAALDGVGFASVVEPPAAGWLFDRAAEASEDNPAFVSPLRNAFHREDAEWYDYDGATHMLVPKDITFVVVSSEGRSYKLRFESYYDDAGSPAVVTFRWAELEGDEPELPPIDVEPAPVTPKDPGDPEDPEDPAPEESEASLTVDASSSWAYLKVGAGVLEVASPESSLDWDLALRRTEVRCNGGASGPGVGGARLEASGAPFGEIETSTTFGFHVDVIRNSGVPGAMDTSQNPVLGGWYDYDGATHRVSPGDRTYLVRTATGEYAKLRVWSWIDGVYELSLIPVERAVDVVTLEVDASGPGWRGLSLASGSVLDEAADPDSLSWDVAFSGPRLRTNSGTSGSGNAAAVELPLARLEPTGSSDLVGALPTAGWVSDALVDGSGNSALATWSVDPDADTLTPRPVVYGIRSAAGHFGALAIVGFKDGRYVVRVAYAGPGRTSL